MQKIFRRALTDVHYSIARLILIHCFDPRPLWFEIWSALCPKGILLVRIPLAGASAKGKHYWKHLKENIQGIIPPVVLATHFPCGWWAECLESMVLNHRKRVVDFLVKMGIRIIGLHFSLSTDMVLHVNIYDPVDLTKEDKIIAKVVAAAKNFEGRIVREEELRPGPIEKVVMAEEVYGPPCRSILVAHKRFFLGDTIEIAAHLGDKKEIPVLPVDVFEISNY